MAARIISGGFLLKQYGKWVSVETRSGRPSRPGHPSPTRFKNYLGITRIGSHVKQIN